MTDLGDRADDYERRLAEAGGTEAVIGRLVMDSERSKKILNWLAISLVFDVVLSLGLGAVAFYAQSNAGDAASTARLAVTAARVSCDASALNTVAVNAVLAQLIENIVLSEMLSEAEKEERIKGYEALIVAVPDCGNPDPV